MSTAISAKDVKALRDRTGAGMMDAKRALEECGGDMEEAAKVLRKKGLADAAKRAGREANEGLVHSYIHPGGRVGVLVEVNCETDFVARNEVFLEFVNDLALHIAALKPEYLSADDVPDTFKDEERKVYAEQAKDVPEHARERAVEGKLAKRLKEIVLLDQEWVRDLSEKKARSVEDVRVETAARLGENVTIRRYALFELGQ